jgi:glyoxylase I family protein
MTQSAAAQEEPRMFVKSVHGIRYQVKDVARAIAFYTNHLGFSLERQQLPCLRECLARGRADVSQRPRRLRVTGNAEWWDTGAPGGWNRIILKVADLPACITALKQAGIQFRNEIETGPGGKQIQIEDPDGNPIELFEPAR